jgi:DNA (cytosine-5)-methyltransferase 1
MQNQTTLSPLRCNPLLYGSLFSGIGGIDLGFDRAGLKCAWQVEIDPFARKVLEKHWPGVPKHDDIRTFKPTPVDVVCGGFPCQDISHAGKRVGIDGERSGLWCEFARVVRDIRPRFVVVENVQALRYKGGGLYRVLSDLAECGYDAEWQSLAAGSFGAPHIRERIILVGYTNKPPKNAHAATGRQRNPISQSGWWKTEPSVGRVADGVPEQMDRLRCLGNAVVPQVAEWIGRRLIESV